MACPWTWRAARIAAGILLAAGAGCDSPAQPSGALQITCPVSVSAQSPTGSPVTVTYGTPTVSGGAPPVTATCSPTSGSIFNVGATNVVCTAVDARLQPTTCSLSVSVSKPTPQLAATNFTAFGDSITEGLLHPCPSFATASYLDDLAILSGQSFRPAQDITTSYPYKLRAALAARYTSQSFVVANEGFGGETTAQGLIALPGVLNGDQPQVLLLQEGTNDIDGIPSGAADPGSAITDLVTNLRAMVRLAQSRGMSVFVGTLTPQRAGACRGFAPTWVSPANDQIRAMVASEGATLVDLYVAFGGVAGDLIGPDGLHPNETGYQKIADTFFASIKGKLER